MLRVVLVFLFFLFKVHREDVNQVISEKLTGMPRIRGSIFDPKELR